MNNYIVNESSHNIRKLARNYMTGLWKPAVLAIIIYLVCTTLPVLILDELFGVSVYEYMNLEMYTADAAGTKISAASGIYSLLVTGPFTLGITIFFIDLIRERTGDIGSVFSGFGFYFKALGLTVVIGIFTFLWTLLFIVPGIIAALRYSQAYFILADDPEKSIMECIRESKNIMKGNKTKFFCLGLSFIGWLFLASLAIGVLTGIVTILAGTGFTLLVIEWILSLMMAGIVAYIFAADTVFYEMVTGNLRPQSDELPPLSQTTFENIIDGNNNSVNEDKIEL